MVYGFFFHCACNFFVFIILFSQYYDFDNLSQLKKC
jgi:hypothetical protein